MSVLPAVQHYLSKKGIGFRFVANDSETKADLSAEMLVNAQFISDGSGLILAIYPVTHFIDFEMLRQRTRRDFQSVIPDAEQVSMRGMPSELFFPMGAWYGVNAIIEKSLLQQPRLRLPAGDGSTWVELNNVQANLLYKESIPLAFTRTDASVILEKVTTAREHVSESALLSRVEKVKDLPPALHTASALLTLMSDPDLSARKLGEFIEKDALLTTLIIKHASAPFYGYRGQLTSVSDAIVHVLGMDMTLNLVLGSVFSSRLTIPQDGFAGRRQLLSESVQMAYAMQTLVETGAFGVKISSKQAYLTGLMNNLGYFVTAHHFPEIYAEFNNSLNLSLDRTREKGFKEVFSISFLQVGAAFLRAMQILPWVAERLVELEEEKDAGIDPMRDMLRIASQFGKTGSLANLRLLLSRYGLNTGDLEQRLVGTPVEQQRKEHIVYTLSEA